jgi:hypothetical protein
MTSRVLPPVRAPRFEAVFQVPVQHELVPVRSRSCGGKISRTFWEHEEYDASGRLVARYESFEESGASGQTASGWRKYDPDRRLVAAGQLWPSPPPRLDRSRESIRPESPPGAGRLLQGHST